VANIEKAHTHVLNDSTFFFFSFGLLWLFSPSGIFIDDVE
jgi:hypothetical protein